jgi:hypothetical protein
MAARQHRGEPVQSPGLALWPKRRLVIARQRRLRRKLAGQVRRSPLMSFPVWLRLALPALILFLLALGIFYPHHGPVTATNAFAQGLQDVTGDRFTPGIWLELIVLLAVLADLRGLRLKFLAFQVNSPIEVKPLDDATRDRRLDTHRLDVIFRDYLALSRLYQIPAVPGDQEPDRIIEVLSTPASQGWRGVFAAALAYTYPRRAFIVTASLLERDRDHQLGVTVQVRRLPGLSVHLETQWSLTFERALQRAAYAVAAYITQQTKACRRIPWSGWARRKRELPVSLFRDYQRAKQYVGERRYDEALALYHSALRQDADNIGIRYDVGQLYERLGLYPDALLTYLGLVDEIFPSTSHIRRTAGPSLTTQSRTGSPGDAQSDPTRPTRHRKPRNRVMWPTWWPWPLGGNRDPFIIRYRYVIALGQGDLLARELISPQWPDLRRYVTGQPQANQDPTPGPLIHEFRPWRVIELEEIARLLSRRLDSLYSSVCGDSLERLLERSRRPRSTRSARASRWEERFRRRITRYLLTCAGYEADALVRDLKMIGRVSRLFRTRRNSFLTQTAARQAKLVISYRLRLLDSQGRKRRDCWPVSLDNTKTHLKNSGYHADSSVNWLEHYNTACLYALALVDDTIDVPSHNSHAYEAVGALDRASRFGDQIEFVTSKKYWLQAGDPDLAGLRYYRSFRAFEARVYGHPLPATAELSRYELYRFLRAVVRQAARNLETAWRSRTDRGAGYVSHADFEEWWRQELRAWEVSIRIGRFYRQWQTRHAALEAIREWFESFGPEAAPIPYPNIARSDYLPDTGDYNLVREMLTQTEDIFNFLGTECGNLVNPDGKVTSECDYDVYGKTQGWSEYAAECSRSGARLPVETVAAVSLQRSAVWASLRQWAQSPGARRRENFIESIRGLGTPPGG